MSSSSRAGCCSTAPPCPPTVRSPGCAALRAAGTPASEAWYAEQREFETLVREAIAHLARRAQDEQEARESAEGYMRKVMARLDDTRRLLAETDASLADALERLRYVEASLRTQASERARRRRGGSRGGDRRRRGAPRPLRLRAP